MIRWNRSKSANRFSPHRPVSFRSPSFSRSHEKSSSRNLYRNWKFNNNRTPSRSKYTEFYKLRRRSRSPSYSSFKNSRHHSFLNVTLETDSFFQKHNFSYRPLTKPRARFVYESRAFVNPSQSIFFEILTLMINFSQSQQTYLKSSCPWLKWQFYIPNKLVF